MKTSFILAIAALSLVACTEATLATSSAESEATSFALHTSERVDVDTKALLRPTCKTIMGAFLSFEYQGRLFSQSVADDLDTCQERLDALLDVPVRPATFATNRVGDAITWTLDFGTGIVFRASNSEISDPDFERAILKSGPLTLDLTTEISGLRCDILQGSWIRFDYRGHSFMTYGADSHPDCETRMAQFRAIPLRHGALNRAVSGESAKWTLAVDGFEFTSFEALRSASDLALVPYFDVTKFECRNMMGPMITMSALGRTWGAGTPKDGMGDCDAIVDLWQNEERHTGQLVVERGDGRVTRSLSLDGGRWLFTAY